MNYKIIRLQRFGSWILLPSSGKNGEKEAGKPIYWAPWSVMFRSFLIIEFQWKQCNQNMVSTWRSCIVRFRYGGFNSVHILRVS
jgi:hypothetical protein